MVLGFEFVDVKWNLLFCDVVYNVLQVVLTIESVDKIVKCDPRFEMYGEQ